jgi:hypothetical protein
MTRANHLHAVPTPPLEDDVRAIASGTVAGRQSPSQSALSRPFGRPSTIAGPSQAFVSLTRNPHLEPPLRFEPTVKGENDVVI